MSIPIVIECESCGQRVYQTLPLGFGWGVADDVALDRGFRLCHYCHRKQYPEDYENVICYTIEPPPTKDFEQKQHMSKRLRGILSASRNKEIERLLDIARDRLRAKKADL